MEPLHIAIIGGGISGVILGIALSKHPHITFKIYESHSAFGEIGAGLGFATNAHRVMPLISPTIWEAYKLRASFNGWAEKEDVWFDFSVGEGKDAGMRIWDGRMGESGRQSTIHRAQFLEELVRLLPGRCAEFDKKLEDIDQTGERIVCKFADGTRTEADAVIGCDGVKSACRSFVYENSLPVFTKKVAYRGMIPMKTAEAALGAEKANNRQMYLGHGGHVLTFPVANGALMNIVAFRGRDEWEGNWVKPLQKEHLVKEFQGWGENVTKIISMIQGTDIWALFDHPAESTFHKGRLCLLGDAAHAMSPHFGQGAGMALEDIYILSNMFGKFSDMRKVFEVYDSIRVPRATRVVAMSREQGKTLDFEGDGVGDDLEKLTQSLKTNVRWIWEENLEKHLKKTIEGLE